MFDWQRFLDERRIDYVTSGANVAKGNLAIHCPLCGAADNSHHMSVSVEGRGWRCWRDPGHRGRSPAKLVSALLNVSYDEAARIVGGSTFIPSDFLSRVQSHMIPVRATEDHRQLSVPSEFQMFGRSPSARPYYEYLINRGFNDLIAMTEQYDLRYCSRGSFKGRVIFLVYFDRQLVTWTGRTIYPSEELRYLTLSTDSEKAEQSGVDPAIGPTSDYLLWYDQLTDIAADMETLLICEGPFDALKINVLGQRHGICATCQFTVVPSRRQIELLHELSPRFSRCAILPDRGAVVNAMRTASALSSLRIPIARLPRGLKDPGEINEEQLLAVNSALGD